MNTFNIEEVHDIIIDTTLTSTEIDFKAITGTITRIELARNDAELLLERLSGALNKV